MMPPEHAQIDDPEWARFLALASVPLRAMTTEMQPASSASGTLVEFCGRQVLLTASHIVKEHREWVIEIRFDEHEGQTQTYAVAGFHVLKRISVGTDEIDFAFAILKDRVTPMLQQLVERPRSAHVLQECERLTLVSDLRETPIVGRSYGFSGQVTAPESGGFWIEGETQTEPHMVFDRADETRYVFRLTHEHPGDRFYKGCSGAPICDADGTLVSVVLGGDPSTREIYGAPLARYRSTIEEALRIGQSS
jgi:hypothetical protein